jgi:hypothetical protein
MLCQAMAESGEGMGADQDKDGEQIRRGFGVTVQELKDGIARLIEPHALAGKSGATTIALIELGIERHLDLFPDEKSARDLVEGILNKVLQRRRT